MAPFHSAFAKHGSGPNPSPKACLEDLAPVPLPQLRPVPEQVLYIVNER
jgi:hypothetical protein